MWHDMFALPVPVAEKILRALFVYLFLVIALRLAGKRELAQLSTFDFVVLLSVANAVQNGIIGNDDSITGAVYIRDRLAGTEERLQRHQHLGFYSDGPDRHDIRCFVKVRPGKQLLEP